MIEERKYIKSEVISFFKTDEKFGVLSNMKGKQEILVNDIWFSSSEAIYQALKYPNYKNIQQKIAFEKSPILAKKISISNKQFIRKDWYEVRNNIMRLCIRIRLLQSQEFYDVLLSTSDKTIVEISRKDTYWGSTISDNNYLNGKNVLGRLLMELRYEIVKGEILKRISHILKNTSNIIINERAITEKSLIEDCKKNYLTIISP